MEALISASNLDEALNKLNLQDLQGILLQEQQSIQGNTHVLKARIKRLVETRRSAITVGFPPVPVSIEQETFSGEVQQISGINTDNIGTRSTVNFDNPPLSSENLNISNISPIVTENNTMLNNTIISSAETTPVSTAQLNKLIYTTSNSQNFTVPRTGNQFLPNTPQLNQTFAHYPQITTQPNANLFNSAYSTASGHNVLPFQNPLPFMQNSTIVPNQQNMFELFSNFLMFMQLMNTQNYGNTPQIQTLNQNPPPLSIPHSNTATTLQNTSSPTVAQPGTSLPVNLENLMDQNLDLVFSEQQTPAKYNVDVKRISYISSTFEKRKIFFSGKSGSDPERFIRYLEEAGKFMGLSEEELFCTLPVVLTNEALEWFRLEEKHFSSFTMFKSAFLEHYKIPYYQDRLMEEARQRTQALREPITSFLTCIRIIFDKMNPQLSLTRQLDIACQNLNPTFSLQVNRSQIHSFDDLLSAGKQVEVKLINMQKYKEPPSADNAVLANAAWHPPKDQKPPQQPKKQKPIVEKKNEIASAKEIISSDKVQKKKTNPPKEKKSPVTTDTVKVTTVEDKSSQSKIEKFPEMPRPGECFKCRQPGHIFKICTNDPVFKSFCYSCGRAKTIAPKCPTCKKDGEGNAKGGQPK